MAHNNLGSVMLQKGQVDSAIFHFRKAIEIRAEHADAQANLGSALLRKGELDEAIAQYDKALEIKPDYALVHYDLANALLLKGQVDEAVDHYKKALEIKPDYSEVCNNLGIVLFQKGKVEEAVSYYQKALEINPQYVEARGNLAWALATSPQTPILKAVAVKLAKQANQMTGGANPKALRILAAAYAQTGKFSEAVETAHQSLQLATNQNNAALEEAVRTDIDFYENGLPVGAANKPP
jgi:tetratricopeptide (TPR) repeat protein